MSVRFYKYQGAGNDFVIIDNRDGSFEASDVEKIAHLCNRRFGIGADGLMLLEEAEGYDFRMVYFNADGEEGSMCGNGGRCIVAFAHDRGLIGDHTRFIAVDGAHEATIDKEMGWVRLKMIDVNGIMQDGKAYVLDTGSPHYVLQVADLAQLDVFAMGSRIRYSERYSAKGINVNFVEPRPEGIVVRTYERGVEDETLACGTGVTAAAIAMAVAQDKHGALSYPVEAMGGRLKVSFVRSEDLFYQVFLEGPAKFVFAGEI